MERDIIDTFSIVQELHFHNTGAGDSLEDDAIYDEAVKQLIVAILRETYEGNPNLENIYNM